MMGLKFNRRFLTDTSDTGRFVIKSVVTGKVYYIEPIDNSPHHKIWGDVNPATKGLEGDYGSKYKGAITEDESMITKENGFDKIHYTQIGESPHSYIDRLDKEWEEKMKNKE